MFDLDEYKYLWDGTESGWVLVRCSAPGQGNYLVFNQEKSRMLLIENSEIQNLVCERLLAQGVRVLNEVPKKEFDITNLNIED